MHHVWSGTVPDDLIVGESHLLVLTSMPDGPVPRAKRVSQMEMEERYELCMDMTLRRVLSGSLAGLAAALLMFRNPARRWSAVAFGAGVGWGSACADAMRLLGDRTFPPFFKRPPN